LFVHYALNGCAERAGTMLDHGREGRLGIIGSLRTTPICVLWFRLIEASPEPGTAIRCSEHPDDDINIGNSQKRLVGCAGRGACPLRLE
jgi:hypothetical protein